MFSANELTPSQGPAYMASGSWHWLYSSSVVKYTVSMHEMLNSVPMKGRKGGESWGKSHSKDIARILFSWSRCILVHGHNRREITRLLHSSLRTRLMQGSSLSKSWHRLVDDIQVPSLAKEWLAVNRALERKNLSWLKK